jgi:branched-chain amino acid transport system permease protein
VLNVQYTVDPLLMTIIGGTGTFAGPVIGAAGLHLLDSRLRNPFPIGEVTVNLSESWNLILGVIFVAVVIVFPQGVVGTWQRWRRKRETVQERDRRVRSIPGANAPGYKHETG